MVEPPYGVIWNRIKSAKVIPFLGAGASLVGRLSDVPWDPQQPQFLPSGRELSRLYPRGGNTLTCKKELYYLASSDRGG